MKYSTLIPKGNYEKNKGYLKITTKYSTVQANTCSYVNLMVYFVYMMESEWWLQFWSLNTWLAAYSAVDFKGMCVCVCVCVYIPIYLSRGVLPFMLFNKRKDKWPAL